jgi:hypothetical protein
LSVDDLDLIGGFLPPLTPNPEDDPVGADCKRGTIRVRSLQDAVLTPAVGWSNHILTVKGSGVIRRGSDWSQLDNHDFASTTGDFVAIDNADTFHPSRPTLATEPAGLYSGGTGWVDRDYQTVQGAFFGGVEIYKSFTGTPYTISSVTMTFNYLKSVAHTNDGLVGCYINYYNGSAWEIGTNTLIENVMDGDGQTLTWTPGSDTEIYGLWLGVRHYLRTLSGTPVDGYSQITALASEGGNSVYGDACYYWTAGAEPTPFDSTKGLRVDAVQLPIPEFRADHVYEWANPDTGTYDYPLLYNLNLAENWYLFLELCELI